MIYLLYDIFNMLYRKLYLLKILFGVARVDYTKYILIE